MSPARLQLSILILVISVVSAVQTIAAGAPDYGSLIEHPEPTEELSKQQLVNKLNELRWANKNRPVPVSAYVADLLYRAKDKIFTEAIQNVTVAELIGANNFYPLPDCSQKALKRRAHLWRKTPQETDSEGATFGVEVYLLRCIHLAAQYCLEHRDQVISEKINDKLWLDRLGYAMTFDRQGKGRDEDSDEDFVHAGFLPFVVAYLKLDS